MLVKTQLAHVGSAKGVSVVPDAMTTYWRPSRIYVIGAEPMLPSKASQSGSSQASSSPRMKRAVAPKTRPRRSEGTVTSGAKKARMVQELGAEVVYDPAAYTPLARFIEAHVAPRGTVLLTDAFRADASRFFAELDAKALAEAVDESERIESIFTRAIYFAHLWFATDMADPINLSIGQPHFDTPEPIKAALKRAVDDGKNAYSQTQGIRPLLEKMLSDRTPDQVLRRWRDDNRLFPVIIVSARNDWTEKVAGIEARLGYTATASTIAQWQFSVHGINRSTLTLQLERRYFSIPKLEVRAKDDAFVAIGHAATFNEPYGVGDFREQVAPGAFDESMKSDEVKALWNHNTDNVLGSSSAGTLRLSTDNKGLLSEMTFPKSAVREREAIERGDVTQMSFGFYTKEDRWERFEDGTELRTLVKVQLFDVSPVAFPANPNTDLGAAAKRSHDAWIATNKPAEPDPAAAHDYRRRKMDLARHA